MSLPIQVHDSVDASGTLHLASRHLIWLDPAGILENALLSSPSLMWIKTRDHGSFLHGGRTVSLLPRPHEGSVYFEEDQGTGDE